MDFKEFEKLFIEECKRNNINIEDINIEKFYNYMLGIIDWNDKINVTAITEKKEFLVKHFIDSLTISRFIEDGKRLIDIGTGAGFPGIPLKIAYPNMEVTLIDSVNKKFVTYSSSLVVLSDNKASKISDLKDYKIMKIDSFTDMLEIRDTIEETI